MELNPIAVSEAASKLGLTPEVFTKFLAKDTPEAEVTPLLTSVKALELFTADQLTQRITNERTAAATEAERNAKGNTYGAMDKRIKDDTGIEKNQGESTIDYMARAAKEKYGTKGDESAEMTRLRGDLTAARTLLTEKETKLQEVEVAHATERKQTQINGRIDAPINALVINTTPELLDSQREYVKYRLFQKYDVDLVDGKEQFTDKVTKEVKRDTKTAAPMTAAALVAEFAPSVVSLKKTSAAQSSGFKSDASDFTSATIDFSQFVSAEAFAQALAKQGITAGDPQSGKLMAEFMKARPELFK